MIRYILNFTLNKILGAKNRYKNLLKVHDSTLFLNSFSINSRFSKINRKIVIGKDCLIGVEIFLESDNAKVEIGDRVYIGKSSIISRNAIKFENDILVSWGVTFYDHDSHSLNYLHRQQDIKQVVNDFKNLKGDYLHGKDWSNVNTKPIHIKSNAWIGFNAIILKGVTIGEGAIVAAGSVVTKDVPPFTIVAGNPAKVVKHINNDE